MEFAQPGILAPVPRMARYVSFFVNPDTDPVESLRELSEFADGEGVVVGIGESLVRSLERTIPGLRSFPAQVGQGVEVPATPSALWCWLRGGDRGELVHRSRSLGKLLSGAFTVGTTVDAFQYGASLDLTGYEDGTENPEGEKAAEAAIAMAVGLRGSSFVAVQQWVHDLNHFQAMPQAEQDHVIGRRKSDNEELDDAPESAHVKRTAQESFDPEAFVLRRSMPWADAEREGLMFVCFGKSFDAFEAQLKRMVGAEDGTVDALFRFTRPITGGYFWCPPMTGRRLDLTGLGL